MEDRYVSRLGKTGSVLIAGIKPGSDLLKSIRNLAIEKGIRGGVILSGVGLLRSANLRNCSVLPEEYPITDENRSFPTFDGPLEILALSRNMQSCLEWREYAYKRGKIIDQKK